jgi:hypothetical protein
MSESELQVMVADYLRMQYPNVLFHSDFGSGIKLTPGQAIKQKRQNGGRRAWPDMFIAEPKHGRKLVKVIGDEEATQFFFYSGLFIELKKEGTRIYKKDGSFASEHIEEQAKMLALLGAKGYKAVFGVGFENTKEIIDNYLGGNNDEGQHQRHAS